ncbi:MAG: type VI secretion system baseplate subunit TssE [Desulfobacterales bacterium]|nr:type VI secretion system baseplate subunit TssE [Desulfobacterales bacterium]
MPEKKQPRRARASLIDRLIDHAPRETREIRPLRTLNREAFRAAIRRDLGWLLNTRTSLATDDFDDRELTVLEYGIPDFGGFSPENEEALEQMAQRVSRAITAYEPRLEGVHVEMALEMDTERRLKMIISAVMAVGEFREPVSFLTIFQKDTGEMEIHDHEAI